MLHSVRVVLVCLPEETESADLFLTNNKNPRRIVFHSFCRCVLVHGTGQLSSERTGSWFAH